MEFLLKFDRVLSKEYFNTFYKSIVRIRPDNKGTVARTHAFMKTRFSEINDIFCDSQLETRMKSLIDLIFKSNLTRWLPGKEIKTLLENSGYSFDDNNIDFEKLRISRDLRKILSH